VAAGGASAVAAGITILEGGGNAADAAAATILALAVTDYGPFCIGGEVPLIFHDAGTRQTRVLSGLGRAPYDREAIAWYYENGIPRFEIKSACVPAVIDLCITALRLFGTITFERAVGPTLDLLAEREEAFGDARRYEHGRWHDDLAQTLVRLVEAEKKQSGPREVKLQAAADLFYREDIADSLVSWYESSGGFLRKGDLAAHVTAVEDPVTVEYKGFTICKCRPWTVGLSLCQVLRLLEGWDLKGMGHMSTDYIHVLAEAMKLAMADRDAYYADPLFSDVPVEALLSDGYSDVRRALIDLAHCSKEIRPGNPLTMEPLSDAGTVPSGGGGTTTCVVADRWGNLVAATPSGWGSTAGPSTGTGIVHGTRLISFNTTEGHPNRIEAGKRPRITLTPTLVLKEGKPVAAISVAGGDLQEQATLNLLLNYVEFGMAPAEAVTAPRFSTEHHEDSFNPDPDRKAAVVRAGSLTFNESFDAAVRGELADRGHEVHTSDSPIGTPVMLVLDTDEGIISVAGDPAARRHAAALD
jgi:gamma-glutamyltranspeptidase/glutathione hydrolase